LTNSKPKTLTEYLLDGAKPSEICTETIHTEKEKLIIVVGARVTLTERKKLQEIADKLEIKVSALIRDTLVNHLL